MVTECNSGAHFTEKKMNYIWLIAYIFLVPDKKNAFITTNGSNCLTRKMRSTHRKIQRS